MKVTVWYVSNLHCDVFDVEDDKVSIGIKIKQELEREGPSYFRFGNTYIPTRSILKIKVAE